MSSKAKLVSSVLPAVFMVEDLSKRDDKNTIGSGIVGTAFIAGDGYLFTAKHVVKKANPKNLNAMSVFNTSGQSSMGTYKTINSVSLHPTLDIAVLKVHPEATRNRILPVRSNLVQMGEEVLLIGFAAGTKIVFKDSLLGKSSPKSFSPIAFSGMISALVPNDGRPVQLLVYDCTTFPGNSGAPLLDKNGKVIGLHRAGYPPDRQVRQIGYSVPITQCVVS